MSKLDLLWLELTAGCNLNCGHCYAESSPSRVGEQHLASDLYIKIIADAAQLGCQRIQFIGGEPTLHNDLPRFLRAAQSARIPHIEVFTNGTRLSDKLIEVFRETGTQVSISFYSEEPEVHDAITQRRGSHIATSNGIKALAEAKIPLRLFYIEMAENSGHFDRTKRYLETLGATDVSYDRVRHIGRASTLGTPDAIDAVGELCGMCGSKRVAVLPDGSVAPCIMSRRLIVGHVEDKPLSRILEDNPLQQFRSMLKRATRNSADDDPMSPQCSPNAGTPDRGIPNQPASPQCSPNRGVPERGVPDHPDSPQCSPNRGVPERGVPDHPDSPQCSPNRGTPAKELSALLAVNVAKSTKLSSEML
jgi:MoaA/NifB/PqqE/SkfB family radical SAM enzyme